LIALAVGVAVHSTATTALAAAPSKAEIVEARLEIETRNAGAGADVLRRRIDERANIVLREAKVLPGDRDDPTLRIVVRELDGDEPGYVASFELRDAAGAPLADRTELECPLCTETELVARVEEQLDAVIELLRESHEQPEPEPTDDPNQALAPGPSEQPTEPTDQPPPPVRQRAGMLGTGITLLVVGGGAIGAGVGLAVPEPKVDEDNPLDLITTRPIGYAVLAGGIAVAVTGAVLTALAVERRRHATRSSASLTPYFDRGRAGLVVGWRF